MTCVLGDPASLKGTIKLTGRQGGKLLPPRMLILRGPAGGRCPCYWANNAAGSERPGSERPVHQLGKPTLVPHTATAWGRPGCQLGGGL